MAIVDVVKIYESRNCQGSEAPSHRNVNALNVIQLDYNKYFNCMFMVLPIRTSYSSMCMVESSLRPKANDEDYLRNNCMRIRLS